MAYYDPAPSLDEDDDRQGLLVAYKLEHGKVYNQLRPVSEDLQSPQCLSKKTRLLVTLCILLTEMGERLTYYSLVANIILFGKSKLGYEEDDVITINLIFAGCVSIIPMGGGFIADSFLGRFRTIVISGLVYIVGIVLVVIASIDFADWGGDNINQDGKRALFISALIFLAIATGGIKATVGPFGAEQVESLGKEAVQSFFNWFYWVVNVGAFIANAGVSYIQQEISFAWGYFVALVTMPLSLILFVAVKDKYIHTKPKVSFQERPEPIPTLPRGSEKKLLARAKVSFGGDHKDSLVDGVGSVIKVIPFCFLLIIYWTIYSQVPNTFFVQGAHMDVRLSDEVNLPVAALGIFTTITLLILIPVIDRLVYPFFERINRPLSYLKRMGIGMVLAAGAMFVAGWVEIERKRLMEEPGGSHMQVLSDKNYTASSMSIFVQIPQFSLMGASEIFTSITSLEFAYNQAPVAMQGLLTGLIIAAAGFGSLLSSAILAVVKKSTEGNPWWGKEINNCKMENLLFLLGGLMLANLLVFCIVSHFYTYQDPSTFETREDNDIEETATSADWNVEDGVIKKLE